MESSGACCPVNAGYSTGTRCVDYGPESDITPRMVFKSRNFAILYTATAMLLVALWAAATLRAESVPAATGDPVEAGFRGCDLAGWCLFRVESPSMPGELLLRVRPDGVLRTDNALDALALRDRLNALLASMIHQAKRIALHDLRELADGTFAAAVTVHGVEIASDEILVALRTKKIRRPKPPD